MSVAGIQAERLLARLAALGRVGRDAAGRLTRLAATDADKAGRDLLVGWLNEAGLEVVVDRIGNIFGLWRPNGVADEPAVLMGSHIDSVIDAGIYDGAYGVLAGLEVIETLRAGGFAPRRPIAVVAFTNEEGVRFHPDMMGSLVFAGGLDLEAALASRDREGRTLGQELARIGYAGAAAPGFLKIAAYVELHIEQGPVLEREGVAIGAVEGVQGICWRRVVVDGVSNHAGATPMSMRADAGLAAAEAIVAINQIALASGTSVATVGMLSFEPNAINVIPSRAIFTVDLRDPDEERLRTLEAGLARALDEISEDRGVSIAVEPLARFSPVRFDGALVGLIETVARRRGLSVRRMTSGAGHDAQMIARVAPSAMIFVPSAGGVSHNPREHSSPVELEAGASVLYDVVAMLAAREER